MTDLALHFAPGAWAADLALIGGDLASDDGLRTAVLISLFTDARARADDPLPEPDADRRGWWGDCGNADPNDRTGSRLWLLARAKAVPATAQRARDYAREALAWMIEDGIATSVEVEATVALVNAGRATAALLIRVTIVRPSGARIAIDYLWDAEANRLLKDAA